jgi:hypothetical protein
MLGTNENRAVLQQCTTRAPLGAADEFAATTR